MFFRLGDHSSAVLYDLCFFFTETDVHGSFQNSYCSILP
uniref:Uncharacterized protein n=1 Tax=Arundo donax TaxID=35708 RepID=A0A0A9EMW1_ARUDO